MIRQWIKAGAAEVLHRTGMDRVIGAFTGSYKAPVVLGYHRVVEDFPSAAATSIPSLLVSTKMFERHLDWIGRRYTFASLDELGKQVESGKSSSKPLAAVTFDDGYEDVYDHAVPILLRKGIPGAVFVVTDLLGTNQIHLHDKLYLLLSRRRLGRRKLPSWKGVHVPDIDEMTAYQATRILLETLPLTAIEQVIRSLEQEDSIPDDAFSSSRSMTWEKAERMSRAGFTLGSHTKNHVVMVNENAGRVREELVSSKNELSQRLGTSVDHFSYPSGLFNTACVEEVAAAGYRFAYTGCTHCSVTHPSLTIPRIVLWENSALDSSRGFSGSVLSCQIHRAFDLISGCKQVHEA